MAVRSSKGWDWEVASIAYQRNIFKPYPLYYPLKESKFVDMLKKLK
jgi:hypothetical protein